MNSILLFKVRMNSDQSRLNKTMHSGTLGQGPVVDEFEEALQREYQSDLRPVTTNSCTSALDLALHLIGIKPGDHVVSTAETCFASNSVIINRGAIIQWADVNPLTGLIDPESVYYSISPKTKAIMAVDWAGRSCDYDKLRSFGIPVIQDAAHCHLTTYKNEPISRRGGDYIGHSYQAIKFLTCSDGGSLITPVEKHEEAILARWYYLDRTKGASFRCTQAIEKSGYKYQLNDVMASIGLSNIELARDSVEKHRANAKTYDRELQDLTTVTIPPTDPGCSYWLYSLLVEQGTKEQFIAHLESKGIASSPVHHRNDLYPATRQFKTRELPGLDSFSSKQVSIPVGWWLSQQDLDQIIEAVRSYKP